MRANGNNFRLASHMVAATDLTSLDGDTLQCLLMHLPGNLAAAAAVCRGWQQATDMPALWKETVCIREGVLATTVAEGVELCECARKRLVRRQLQSISLHLELKVRISEAGLMELAESLPAIHTLNLHQCCNATDAAVDAFARLCPQLRSLSLASCPLITDDAIVRLAPLPLTSLDVSFCEITDEGLAALAPQTALRSLVLQECKMPTGAGIQQLGKLKSLTALDLTASPACDESLELLAGALPELRQLSLAFCSRITSVSCLRRCRHLRVLGLAGCRLSCFAAAEDEAEDEETPLDAQPLDPLDDWPRLAAVERLSLMWCAIGDVPLTRLARALPALRALDVSWTMVTPAGAAAFCKLVRGIALQDVCLTPGMEAEAPQDEVPPSEAPPACDGSRPIQ